MPTTYKVLGQSAPSATTATTLYTSSGAAIISTINVANLSSAPDTIRIAIRPAGASLSNEHYIVYGVQVPGGSLFTFTGGVTLANTDVITIYSTTGNSAFSAFGTEGN